MMAPSIRITVLLTAAIAIVVMIAASSGPPISALTDPIVSVDAIPDASNTATTVGNIDPCRSTNSGATFDVDVVIQQGVNQEISGFQANVIYDPLVLNVTAVNYNFLLASTGQTVWVVGEAPPDSDGDFLLAAATLIIVPGGSYASGPGVLARMTVTAVGSGPSPLELTNLKLADGNGNPIQPSDASNFYIGPVNGGSVAVDTACSGDTDGDSLGLGDPPLVPRLHRAVRRHRPLQPLPR